MSDYTKELDRLKADHRDRVAQNRADQDLTEEARTRRIRELDESYAAAYTKEKARVMERISAERERLYRKANPVRKPGTDTQRELLREMRLQRVEREVRELFEEQRHDPLLAYQEAVRVGDDERVEVIGRLGPRYLKDSPGRRGRL